MKSHFPLTQNFNRALRLSLLIGTCLGTSMGIVWAGPEGGVVSQGSASIAQNGTNTTINQNSNRVLIDWQGFNVGENESVKFLQPGASSVAVNRIHDTNPSSILGSLSANGQIVLINPNGVTFGNHASVDVNGLVVSTAAPTDSDAATFISGQSDKLNLSIAGNPNAKIINAGRITAKDAGLVGFVAPHIVNNGIIIANKGNVHLASGDMATLDLYGDGLVDIAVSPAMQNQLIEQNGWVQADGGTVLITAAAGEHIVNSVINMGGVTQAQSIEQKSGKIVLKGDNSTVNVTGKIDATGKASGHKGGAVTITGKHINLKAGSLVDTSGDMGGGTIKIGGDYQGKGDLHRAKTVTMEKLAEIRNAALTSGDGGTTILWSDDHTYFAGNIFAQGAAGGTGGFLETSGKHDLTVTGQVDLSAIHGTYGTWLLDPTNITIYNRNVGGTDNSNTVTTAYLEGQGASIILTADNDLTFDMTGDTLTLGADRSFTATATTGNISSASAGSIVTSGAGNISLTAGGTMNLASGGNVTLNTGSGGTTTLSSVGNMTLADITSHNISATVSGSGNTISAAAITAISNGNTTLTADDLTLNGTLSGGGELLLQPYAVGRDVRVKNGVGDFNLDNADLSHIPSGWNSVKIGRSNSNGTMYLGSHGWNNSVAFQGGANGVIVIDSGQTVEALGYNLFSFGAGRVDLYGDVIANGSNMSFDTSLDGLHAYGGSITANGGTIYIQDISIETSDLNITNNNGSISIFHGIREAFDSTGKTVTLNATNGTLLIYGNVDGAYDLTATGNAMNFNYGTWGDSTPLGDVSLTSVSSLILPSIKAASIEIDTDGTLSTAAAVNMTTSGAGSIVLNATGGIALGHALGLATAGGNITLNDDMTSTVSQSFNAGTGTITTKAVAMGAHNLTLIADDLVLGDTVHGTGILTLAPYSNTGREMRINFYGGDFNLDNTEIGYLGNGWSMVNIGTGSTQNGIKVADTSWASPVTFKTTGEVIFYNTNEGTGDASITTQSSATHLLGTLTTQGGDINLAKLNSHSAVIDSNGGNITLDVLRLYADSNPNSLNVTSDDGDITMTGTEWLVDGAISSIAGKNVIFDAGTGSVTYGGTFEGAYNLSVTGGTIALTGNIGGNTALGNVVLTAENSMSLPSITAASILAQTTGATADITIGSGKVLTSSATGTGITLAAGRNFINQNGSGALVAQNGGRWLVYSTDVTGTTGEQNLSSAFRRYSCTYGGTCPTLGTGNGLLYSYTPLLDVTPDGGITGTYGQNVSLNGYNYTVSGYLSGDTGDNVTGTLNGKSDYAIGENSGSYDLEYDSGTLSSAMGYGFNYLDKTNGITIGKAGLTITANSFNKTGNTSYVFAGTEFTHSTLVSGDSITHVDLASAGSSSGAAAGPYSITAANATGSGLGNYNITYLTGTLTVTAAPTPPPIASTPVPQQVIAVQTTQNGNLMPSQQSAEEGVAATDAGATDGEDGKPDGNCLYSVVNFKDVPSTSGGCS